MPRFAALLLALALSPLAFAADTPNNAEGIAAVEEIGRINGLALACTQPAISSRARNAIVTGAPKTRAYGETFEAATHATFLNQGQGFPCPDGAALSSRLEAAEKRLAAAFAPR